MLDHLPTEHRLWQTLIEVRPDPAKEYLPAAQAMHWASELSPDRPDHLPAEQRPWHWSSEDRPVWLDHLPAEQPWH